MAMTASDTRNTIAVYIVSYILIQCIFMYTGYGVCKVASQEAITIYDKIDYTKCPKLKEMCLLLASNNVDNNNKLNTTLYNSCINDKDKAIVMGCHIYYQRVTYTITYNNIKNIILTKYPASLKVGDKYFCFSNATSIDEFQLILNSCYGIMLLLFAYEYMKPEPTRFLKIY
jgi:hypothetical protein